MTGLSLNGGTVAHAGSFSFAAQLTDAVGFSPRSITTGDFNGDGHIDLATGNAGANTVSVLLGNGDGTFRAPSTYSDGNIEQGV